MDETTHIRVQLHISVLEKVLNWLHLNLTTIETFIDEQHGNEYSFVYDALIELEAVKLIFE